MPVADVYFDWGYTVGCGTETVMAAVTGIGTYQVNLTGYDNSNPTVYYRGAIDADGTNYGSVSSFASVASTAASGRDAGITFLGILPIIIAGVIIIASVATFKTMTALLISTIIGVIAFYVVQAMIGTL